MQISPVSNSYNSSSYSNKTTFTGLTKVMKNRIYLDGQKDISEIIEKQDLNLNKNQFNG